MTTRRQSRRHPLPAPQKLTPAILDQLGEEFRAWSEALESRTQAMEIMTSTDMRTRAK